MCGIISSFDKQLVELGLDILRPRGRDNAAISEEKGYFLGHTLHAIVGRVSQPITHEGTLIANCEIYNWKALAEKYNLHAANDADLLCQLLDTQSVSTVLEQLDGVYAFVYKKDNMIIATRDLLGVKPLWYTTDPRALSKKQTLEIE